MPLALSAHPSTEVLCPIRLEAQHSRVLIGVGVRARFDWAYEAYLLQVELAYTYYEGCKMMLIPLLELAKRTYTAAAGIDLSASSS